MDIALLAAFLSPFLPHLMKVGGQATEKITEVLAKNFGEAASSKAERIWAKLYPNFEEKEDLKLAATQVAAKPDSSARLAFFQEELENLFSTNSELAKEIAQIVSEPGPDGMPSTQIMQDVTGNKNQTIGQVFGGKILGNVDGNVTL